MLIYQRVDVRLAFYSSKVFNFRAGKDGANADLDAGSCCSWDSSVTALLHRAALCFISCIQLPSFALFSGCSARNWACFQQKSGQLNCWRSSQLSPWQTTQLVVGFISFQSPMHSFQRGCSYQQRVEALSLSNLVTYTVVDSINIFCWY